MELELSEILGKKVDLVPKNALKPRIGKRILEEVKYIYERTDIPKHYEFSRERIAPGEWTRQRIWDMD
jgi:hypothetical protein